MAHSQKLNTARYYVEAVPYWTQSWRAKVTSGGEWRGPQVTLINLITCHLEDRTRYTVHQNITHHDSSLNTHNSSYQWWSIQRLSLRQLSECLCRLKETNIGQCLSRLILREQGPNNIPKKSKYKINPWNTVHVQVQQWIHTKAHQNHSLSLKQSKYDNKFSPNNNQYNLIHKELQTQCNQPLHPRVSLIPT